MAKRVRLRVGHIVAVNNGGDRRWAIWQIVSKSLGRCIATGNTFAVGHECGWSTSDHTDRIGDRILLGHTDDEAPDPAVWRAVAALKHNILLG